MHSVLHSFNVRRIEDATSARGPYYNWRARKRRSDNARYQAEMADYNYMVSVTNDCYTWSAIA